MTLYARINSPAGFIRFVILLAVFAFAGFVACEWLLATDELAKDPKPKKLTIATWNLEWFYDDFVSDNRTEQDVTILYQSGLVEYSRREQTQEMFDSKEYHNLGKQNLARFQWGSSDEKETLLLLNAHLRAGAEKSDLQIRQCRLIHGWLQDEIKSGGNVIATGDFNTEFVFGKETGTDEMSVVRGLVTEDKTDDLLDANKLLSEGSRSKHLSGKQFDRLQYSASLETDTPDKKDLVIESAAIYKDAVVNGTVDRNHWDVYYKNPQAERDNGDHYPLVVTFAFK